MSNVLYEIECVFESDIKQIKQIEKICGLSPWSFNEYLTALEQEGYVFLKVRRENKILGFTILRLIKGNNPTPHYKDNLFDLELLNIGVLPDHRNKGLAKLLLKTVVKENHKINNVILEVRISNKNAIEFYQNRGFIILSRRKDLYQHPNEDGLIMNLNLKQ